MICNIARVAAGGGGESAGNWELIETFTGDHIVTESKQYNVKISAEPNGTPYNFKAVAVEMEAVSANTGTTQFYSFSVETPVEEVYINAATYDYKSKGTKGILLAVRANGLLIKQESTWNPESGSVAGRSGNITGINIRFNAQTSSYKSPTNIQFKVYAVRA